VTSALLKLPRSMSKAQKLQRVEQLLALLVRHLGLCVCVADVMRHRDSAMCGAAAGTAGEGGGSDGVICK
jgi:hypothetical protein